MCWVAGSIVGFLPLFGWHAGTEANAVCLFVKVMDYNYLVFLYFATIITPAILMLAFYAHIYRVIIRQVKGLFCYNSHECIYTNVLLLLLKGTTNSHYESSRR